MIFFKRKNYDNGPNLAVENFRAPQNEVYLVFLIPANSKNEENSEIHYWQKFGSTFYKADSMSNSIRK